MEIGQDRDCLATLDGFIRCLVEKSCLVQGHALAKLNGALGFLHHLDGGKQKAGTVITNHTLGQTIGSSRGCSSTNLEPRNTHDVGMEGLRVFGTQGLVGGSTSSTNNGHRHVESTTGSGIGVAGRTNFGHTVNTKVGIHQFHNGSVSVQGLTKSLADKVSLVNNFIGGTSLAIGLLGQLGNIIRGSRLQIFGMDGGGRISKHFFVNGQVNGITNRDFSSLGLGLKCGNVVLNNLHLLGRNGSGIDGIRKGRSLTKVIVRIWCIGKFQFLGKFHRRHGRLFGKFDTLLNFGQHFFAGLLQFFFREHTSSNPLVFKSLDGVLGLTGPCLFFLSAPFVFGISWRVSIETVGVNLKNGRSLATANVVNHCLSSLGNINGIHTVDQKTRNSVVLSLLVDIAVLGNIGGKSVNGTTIVNH
mmetsp:Transcript_9883/g.28326  ORF Transcript_9883/g.28326 Transcript_9883/m.28326 type:complete len:415 (+) Transcript_9883:547-1791(+)